MPLNNGSRIGSYEIVAPLGAGGMGEVYRARDSKLNREVAIKVLPAALADDPQYMARFEREAQTLAALNHPNIATVYGIERGALVMELVEGPTLADRIARGPLPLDEALPIARQIAEGLEAAHERGVVHRDLKPANVKITPAGAVKILDFGLAKTVEAVSAGANTLSPTLSLAMTQAGYILGTAGYMSPEQARGKPVDRRADIWAYGVVLYEMLTGKTLFGGGETVSDALAAVLTRDPDWDALPASTPPHLRRLLERCLRKDAKTRLQAIGEARVSIDEPWLEAAPAAPRRAKPGWVAWTAAALAAAAAAAGWWRAVHPTPGPFLRLTIELAERATLGPDITAAISPAGDRIAFRVSEPNGIRLVARKLDEPKYIPLDTGVTYARAPFFSPDGQSLAYFADAKLKRISTGGGAPITLCDAPNSRGGWWGEDGTIVASLDGRSLSLVPEGGGTPRIVATPKSGSGTYRYPQILPGGKFALATYGTSDSADYEDATIGAVSLQTGEFKPVHRGGFFGRYVEGGFLVYTHQAVLFAIPFDADKLETRGSPVPIAEGVGANSSWGAGNFDVARNGALVYAEGEYSVVQPLVWLDAAGRTVPVKAPLGYSPRLSPDGKRVALTVNNDIAVFEFATETVTRLTFNPRAAYRLPVWTPDGRHVVFSDRDGVFWWTRADGSAKPVELWKSPGGGVPSSISPDGKRLVLHQSGDGTNRDIWILPLDIADPDRPRAGKPERVLATPVADVDPVFSPDGRWLAYSSMEAGAYQIFVRDLAGSGVWQVSADGGRFPKWSHTGRELLYMAANQRVMACGYSTDGSRFAAGKPRQWSEVWLWVNSNNPNFDVGPDGRVLGPVSPSAQRPVRAVLLLNLPDELRRRTGR